MYHLYADKVLNTALSYTKNIEDAEEVTQDVFLKIYQGVSRFNHDAAVSTWIYRITINTSLNYLKKKNRFKQFKNFLSQKQAVDFIHPGVVLENKEKAKILFEVIDCLSSNQKTAFILSYIEDLPRKEVAEIMGVSLKAVESLLQRAKQKMRGELQKIYPNRRK